MTATSKKTILITRMLQHKLLVVLAICVVARLVVFFAVPSVFRFEQTGAVHGSDAYDTYAQNLLRTGIYGRTSGVPDAVLAPLYSYVLAGVYATLGRSGLAVASTNIVFDCLSIICLYFIGKRLFKHGDWVGALAGLFYALYPYLIFQNLTLIDTPFFMVLLYAFVLLMVLLRERVSLDKGIWGLAALAGVILGLSMLTRALLPALAILAALWFLFRLSLWQTVMRLLPVAVIGFVVMLPWIIRNYGLYGALVPTALNYGDNFYQGNSEYTIPYFRAGYDVQWVPPPPIKSADVFSLDAARERFDAGVTYLTTHPEQIPDLIWTKFLIHWSIDIAPRKNPVNGAVPRLDYHGNALSGIDAQGNLELGQLPPGDPVGEYSSVLFDQIGRPIHILYWGGLLLLGIIGIGLSWRQWRDVSLLWFVQISMMVMYIIFHPSTRYRVPTDPLLFLFSAYTVIWLWQRFVAKAK
ncbi:MAG: glycosyltransferase family 39 protein [Anaerolineae bacterium]|nr:glycosyltransferase family 39 protein [Anaerolineae bacterium]